MRRGGEAVLGKCGGVEVWNENEQLREKRVILWLL